MSVIAGRSWCFGRPPSFSGLGRIYSRLALACDADYAQWLMKTPLTLLFRMRVVPILVRRPTAFRSSRTLVDTRLGDQHCYTHQRVSLSTNTRTFWKESGCLVRGLVPAHHRQVIDKEMADLPPPLSAAGLIVPMPSVMFLEPFGTLEDCSDGE